MEARAGGGFLSKRGGDGLSLSHTLCGALVSGAGNGAGGVSNASIPSRRAVFTSTGQGRRNVGCYLADVHSDAPAVFNPGGV